MKILNIPIPWISLTARGETLDLIFVSFVRMAFGSCFEKVELKAEKPEIKMISSHCTSELCIFLGSYICQWNWHITQLTHFYHGYSLFFGNFHIVFVQDTHILNKEFMTTLLFLETHLRNIQDPSETYWKPTCLIKKPSETNKHDLRPTCFNVNQS